MRLLEQEEINEGELVGEFILLRTGHNKSFHFVLKHLGVDKYKVLKLDKMLLTNAYFMRRDYLVEEI